MKELAKTVSNLFPQALVLLLLQRYRCSSKDLVAVPSSLLLANHNLTWDTQTIACKERHCQWRVTNVLISPPNDTSRPLRSFETFWIIQWLTPSFYLLLLPLTSVMRRRRTSSSVNAHITIIINPSIYLHCCRHLCLSCGCPSESSKAAITMHDSQRMSSH